MLELYHLLWQHQDSVARSKHYNENPADAQNNYLQNLSVFHCKCTVKFNNYGAVLLQDKKLIPQTGTTGITFKSSEMVK